MNTYTAEGLAQQWQQWQQWIVVPEANGSEHLVASWQTHSEGESGGFA